MGEKGSHTIKKGIKTPGNVHLERNDRYKLKEGGSYCSAGAANQAGRKVAIS